MTPAQVAGALRLAGAMRRAAPVPVRVEACLCGGQVRVLVGDLGSWRSGPIVRAAVSRHQAADRHQEWVADGRPGLDVEAFPVPSLPASAIAAESTPTL